MRNVLLSLFILTTSTSFAQKRPGEALEPLAKPVSVSYKAVIECEPGLKDPRMSQKVDPVLLKARIDEVFVTHRSLLLKRVVDFRERSGELRRMILENNPVKGQNKFSAQWWTIPAVGDPEIWDDSGLKLQPTLQEVHLAIAKGVIEKDETLTDEFKLKDVKLRVKKDLKQILELRLEKNDGSMLLACDQKSGLGTICTCTKKRAPVRSR